MATNDGLDVVVDEIGFDITYNFSNTEVEDATSGTVQNSFITLDENGVVTVNDAASAIGRKPVVKVEAEVGGTVIATGYIVIQIVASDITGITVTADPIDLEYSEIDQDNAYYPFEWQQINEEVYDALDMSAAQFAAIYNATPEILGYQSSTGDSSVPGIGVANLSFPTSEAATANFLRIRFSNVIPVSTGSDYKEYGKITLIYKANVANTYPDVTLVIPYTVTDNCKQDLSYSNLVTGGVWNIYGDATTPAGYSFGALLKQAFAGEVAPVNNHTFAFKFADEESSVTTLDQATLSGSTWDATTITFDGEINGTTADNKPVTTTYNVVLAATRANKEVDEVTYPITINFMNPLAMDFDKGNPDAEPAVPDPLATTFANNDFAPVDIKDALNIYDGRGRGVTIYDGGAVVAGNVWGVTADDVDLEFELIGDWGGAFVLSDEGDAEGEGVFSYSGTGFAYDLPLSVQVRVTATVDGIAVMSEIATITINPAE